MSRRLGVVVAHLLALPVAAVLSLALVLVFPTTVSQQAINVALHDTYFLVAHFHASILLGSCVAVTTLVAHRYGRVSWPLRAAWGLLALHVLSAVVLWGAPTAAEVREPVAFVLRPAHPGLAYLYLGSSLAGFVATLVGLLVSFASGLRSGPRTA